MFCEWIMGRFVFGGEPVCVSGFGVGVLVDRQFIPDGWEFDPLYLVMLSRGRRAVAAACDRGIVSPVSIDAVPIWLRDEAWAFMEKRSR